MKSSSSAPAKKVVVISMMTLAIMNVTTIVSLRGLPAIAEYGLTSIFYYVFAALVFLIPVSLIAAELASTFPEKGGIFRWVGEAFGGDWGFAAIYYEWQTIVIWFSTVLIFAAVALAYVWMPLSFDAALAANKIYTILIMLAVYWGVTIFTFRGMQWSARLSSFGGLLGTIIPGAILIVLGIVYVLMGKPIQMPLNTGFFPNFADYHSMVLAAGIFLYFAGMEVQAVHITHLKNPTRDYPLSVLIATVAIILIFVLGTLAVGVVIPQRDINLTQSLLVAYDDLWSSIGLPWMGNVMAAMLAVGVVGQVSVLVAGPSTGLLAVGKAGYLPRILEKTNTYGMPVPILLVQGIIVTLLSLFLIGAPSVQAAFQILSQMATVIILVMYLIMYAAAVRLRYTQPKKTRPFKIPGGLLGIWFVAIIGMLGDLIACVLSFLPPPQIATGNPVVYVGMLLVGSAIFLAIPFIIYAFHKPEWKAPDSDFVPFDWQIEGRKPSEVSTLPTGSPQSGGTATNAAT